MPRNRNELVYLDTHVVAWLYQGLVEKFNPYTIEMMNNAELRVSPIVAVELDEWYKQGKINQSSDEILNELHDRIGLQLCDQSFSNVSKEAKKHRWAKNMFDRLIVASASFSDASLISKDAYMHVNYAGTIW